jgi:hypothetical protein
VRIVTLQIRASEVVRMSRCAVRSFLKSMVRSVIVTSIMCSAAISPVHADPAGLDGSWSGGGTVTLSSGAQEQARCRATFRRQTANAFTMSAVCATSSGRATQSGELVRTGANRFSGDFYNPEFGISGRASIVVEGRSMTAILRGGGGSARLSLSR